MSIKTKNFKTILYIFFIILLQFLVKFSTAYADTKNYVVKDVEVIQPYDLDFNKLKIYDFAFKKAFNYLILQITISNDRIDSKNIDLKTVRGLVDSFSIEDEKFINKKYISKFIVKFNKKKVINFLNKKNIISSIPINKELVLLPILIDIENNQISLFSENIFYKLWNYNEKKYFLLNYVLPNEDLEDIKILQKNIDNIEQYNFLEILDKYNYKDYIVVIIYKYKNKVRVLTKLNLNNQLFILNEVFKDINLKENESAQVIIDKLKINYENQWKKLNQINTSIKLPITLSINSKNIKLINKFEKKLSEFELVSNYNIENISSNNTVYKLMYNGTPDKFLQQFRSNGFNIDTSYKIWKIK